MKQRREPIARLRALVVDDDDDIRLLICRALQRVGFEVRDFSDGESLIAQPAELAQAHVVISDIGLPGVDGIDVCTSLRRYFPELPVILVTAFRDEALEHRAHAAGARQIMTKPLNIGQLAEQAFRLTRESR